MKEKLGSKELRTGFSGVFGRKKDCKKFGEKSLIIVPLQPAKTGR